MPVEKASGDKVTGGTLNTSGSFVMEAERVGSETMLAQIVKLVSEAQRSRAPMQRLADKVAAYFVPAVVAAAVLTFLRLGVLWPAAALRARTACRRCRADHRLPLRAGSRHAHVHHGRRRARRARRRPRAQRRSPRNPRQSRHAGGRQDRHAHRRQAARRRMSDVFQRERSVTKDPSAFSCGQPREGQRASSGASDRAAAEENRLPHPAR